jgi:hypothetical protein
MKAANQQNVLIPWTDIDGAIENPADIQSLCSKWIVPPFSVLDSRQKYWQQRKRLWLNLGIESELGRGEAITWGIDPNGCSTVDETKAWTERGKQKVRKIDPSPSGSPRPACDYSKGQRGDGRGRPLARTFGQDLMKGENPKFGTGQPVINSIFKRDEDAGGKESSTGTSIFDPTLTEVCYQWFVPKHGTILDPFAGGSVRGIVASITGRKYVGIDLSKNQIKANREQAKKICPKNMPRWIIGDSADVLTLAGGKEFDFLMSCPPYGSLERYSDDPRDLSTMSWTEFVDVYRKIIRDSLLLLRPNRFALFVVGNFRSEKRGVMRDLVGQTIGAFEGCGAWFYNEGIFINAIGSLPVRVNKQMVASRKLGKGHQNVLVFVKGDFRKAVEEIGNEGINGWPYKGE